MTGNGHPRQAPLRILGIGGSTRRRSKSRALLASALRLAEAAGAEVTLADVRALDLPIYDPERSMEEHPPSLPELLAAARAADAYILCSPTYHGSVSGAVKNALDALEFLGNDDPPYFGGKPVALMALNGLAITTVVTAHGSAISDGEVTDEMVQRRLRWMTDELLELAVRLRRPAAVLSEATA